MPRDKHIICIVVVAAYPTPDPQPSETPGLPGGSCGSKVAMTEVSEVSEVSEVCALVGRFVKSIRAVVKHLIPGYRVLRSQCVPRSVSNRYTRLVISFNRNFT